MRIAFTTRPLRRLPLGPGAALALTLALVATTGSVAAAVPAGAPAAMADIEQLALDLDVVAKPAIVPPKRSRTVAAPVPPSLLATLHVAATTLSLPYLDGCHGAPATTTRCYYGNLSSKTTIALFGDSHALSWFPAMLKVAQHRGWKLLNLTRSACIPAGIIPYDRRNGFVMRSLPGLARPGDRPPRAGAPDHHRRVRNARVRDGRHGRPPPDRQGQDGRLDQGDEADARQARPGGERVILLADTPSSLLASPATCLARNPGNALRCSTTVAHAISYPWLSTEYRVARGMGAGFLNVERWVCPTSPCPAVIGTRLVYRNPGHLTASFTASQWLRLEQAILKDLARRNYSHWP